MSPRRAARLKRFNNAQKKLRIERRDPFYLTKRIFRMAKLMVPLALVSFAISSTRNMDDAIRDVVRSVEGEQS
ncbi:MAG TPA: hypothetical protein VJ577_05460 [Burkholderiaceae bacterium]|nr:hypothetical protein [Burkholderiaceae bacterium]